MSVPKHVLAIDLGTSGPKVALVTDGNRIVGPSVESVGLHLDGAGGAEQDPDEWWEAIVRGVRRTREQAADVEIAAIAVTAQWSGTVPVDKEGMALGNAIIWMDSRGERYLDDLRGGGPISVQGYSPRKLRRWISRSGGAPSGAGKDPIAHIVYLREERPDLYSRTAMFLEPKDYINLRLTGRAVGTFDSIALHWVADTRDPDAVDYDDTLLSYAGLSRSQLPPLIHATGIVGGLSPDAAGELRLPVGIPVIGGTPDVHSACIGAGTVRDHAAHLYIGTSSWLTCHVPYKKTDLIRSVASLPAPVPGRWIAANEQETAGKALDWAASVLLDEPGETVHEEMNALAASAAPGSGGLIFTPWLYGERTPVEDAHLRSGFFNQSLETGRAEMARSVFEGVAYNTRWLLEAVERFTKRRLDPIAMVGGGARSELWAQIHADVLDRTIIRRSEPLWVNVRGAGMLAHAALGHVGWSEIDGLTPTEGVHEPRSVDRVVYDDRYATFRRIHKATRGIYRQING